MWVLHNVMKLTTILFKAAFIGPISLWMLNLILALLIAKSKLGRVPVDSSFSSIAELGYPGIETVNYILLMLVFVSEVILGSLIIYAFLMKIKLPIKPLLAYAGIFLFFHLMKKVFFGQVIWLCD